ncbi:MAG TPA: hypothetical protein VJS20_11875 [Gemmatimonadales bacterium]|nr:hypothetical protein [Gemmatimonadales bacterium]
MSTTVVVSVTSNLRLIDAPGNVLLPRRVSGLTKGDLMEQVDAGLRLLLSL